jgi:2-polyprenyl-6-hydroxyphenyl methylase/3-demethylubiquinone-9 3-methyltransferase
MRTSAELPPNADRGELSKFDALAHRFWDPRGEFRPLHLLNPIRLGFVVEHATLAGARALDVGCGGGLLSESLSRKGARVTGIDLAPGMVEVARLHAAEEGLEVDYRVVAAEELAASSAHSFDVITCMEMLEHVPQPASTVAACATLVKPGGLVVFATLSRTPKAYLFAIIGAEYLLRLLPRGTHDYARFIRPSELATFARQAGLEVDDLIGMTYNPLTRTYRLEADTAVNYIATFHREA